MGRKILRQVTSDGPRRVSRAVPVGPLVLGGNNPVRVQSMTNTATGDVKATLRQIGRLRKAGCELVRVAVSSRAELRAFGEIRQGTSLPLIADIQYNHRFAIECLRLGADKVRLNPGNIGPRRNLISVLRQAGKFGKAVRLGINAGSLPADLLRRYGGPTASAMTAGLERSLAAAEDAGFDRIVVSLKSSSVMETIAAYRAAAAVTEAPFHLGITEAGGILSGAVKSAVGLGILLHQGIGDTIRVSLTGPPEAEISVAYKILRALELRRRGVEVISCPTCSRCQMDIISMAGTVEKRLSHLEQSLCVAVMGCYVNGPGEARHADVGLAGGAGGGVIFRRGQIVRRVSESDCVPALVAEAELMAREISSSGGGHETDQR